MQFLLPKNVRSIHSRITSPLNYLYRVKTEANSDYDVVVTSKEDEDLVDLKVKVIDKTKSPIK